MAGMFDNSVVLQVQQANDIVEVIGEHVSLKKKGREMVGLCPFHADHRPSMNVSIVKQIFKCFACGAGGNVIQFVQMRENLTFPQAIERLAERAGIKLERRQKARVRRQESEGQEAEGEPVEDVVIVLCPAARRGRARVGALRLTRMARPAPSGMRPANSELLDSVSPRGVCRVAMVSSSATTRTSSRSLNRIRPSLRQIRNATAIAMPKQAVGSRARRMWANADADSDPVKDHSAAVADRPTEGARKATVR